MNPVPLLVMSVVTACAAAVYTAAQLPAIAWVFTAVAFALLAAGFAVAVA